MHIRLNTRNDPSRKIRLQNEVSKLRRVLGHLTQYRRGETACKLSRELADIFHPRMIHGTRLAELDEVIYSFMQKLSVLSERLRRYKRADAREIRGAASIRHVLDGSY